VDHGLELRRRRVRAGLLPEAESHAQHYHHGDHDAGSRVADYSVASGLFDVRLDEPIELWERFVARTLAEMRVTSRLGVAVNFAAPRAQGQAARTGLYRVSPESWVAYCEEELQLSVELLTGYGLQEFTLLVRQRVAVS